MIDDSSEYGEYSIDPTELAYETECTTYESTNSRTNYLGKEQKQASEDDQ